MSMRRECEGCGAEFDARRPSEELCKACEVRERKEREEEEAAKKPRREKLQEVE